MILTDKTTGRFISFTKEEITLDNLKSSANVLCKPDQQVFDRQLVASFNKFDKIPEGLTREQIPEFIKKSFEPSRELEKLYEELALEATRIIERMAATDRLLGSSDLVEGRGQHILKMQDHKNLTEIFIAGLGKLIIQRP